MTVSDTAIGALGTKNESIIFPGLEGIHENLPLISGMSTFGMFDTPDPGTIDPGTTNQRTTDPGATDKGTTDPGTDDPGSDDPGTTDQRTADQRTADQGTTAQGTTDQRLVIDSPRRKSAVP